MEDPRFLPKIFQLATEQAVKIKKEALWIISNVTGRDDFQVQMLLENGDYIDILKDALFAKEPEVKF